jgi:SAM-dependent methyltransferase
MENRMTAANNASEELTAEAFAKKMFGSFLGSLDTLGFYAGERLGWYQALADHGPLTTAELAERTGTNERYAREWLEMQATFGHLRVADPAGSSASERRYAIPAGVAEVMTDVNSLAYLGALPRVIAAIAPQLDRLLDAYRTGGGVSWAELGDHAREAQAATNRPWFESRLAGALASVPDLNEILAAPGARIADVGCGAGWSTIALARAYPDATLVGFDIDAPSIAMAEANAAAAGVSDRVSFHTAGAETLTQHPPFDAAFAFECLHDMPRPIEVLTPLHKAVRPDGAVVIMDEAVADSLQAPGDEVEQVMYGYSMFVCLPDGLSSTPSAGTGTVMRKPILDSYAQQAGFRTVDVLPIEDFAFFRFYQLKH